VAAVMIHVADVRGALAWYARAFPSATRHRVEEADFDFLRVDGVPLEFVPADAKVGAGAAGSVVYWRVPDFAAALAHFLAAGAALYRGPMTLPDGQRMCQVRDPWGNCIGMRGPAVA
jgi:predicted enzyme related to lactoylglutathione lyase